MCIRDSHLVRQYYEQNSHIVLIDTGNSYQGLCELIPVSYTHLDVYKRQ